MIIKKLLLLLLTKFDPGKVIAALLWCSPKLRNRLVQTSRLTADDSTESTIRGHCCADVTVFAYNSASTSTIQLLKT